MSFIRNLFTLAGPVLRQRQIELVVQSRGIKRWVAPTLRELRKRNKQQGPRPTPHRSSFTDWNHNAELFAFGKRLSEEFQMPVLQQAFVTRSYIIQQEAKQKEIGIESPSLGIEDNRALIESGNRVLTSFVEQFISERLPKRAPSALRSSVVNYLLSTELLAKISKNLGTSDLILSTEFPVLDETLADTFKAVVGALLKSSSEEQANRFIHDFVCTHLNQLDYSTLWKLENPFEELEALCANENLGVPEARLIGEGGKNTLLAVYNVGIYCNKKLIGSGFGETVNVAIAEASSDAIRGFYKIQPHQQMVRF